MPAQLLEDFEDRWEQGQVLSWEDQGVGRGELGRGSGAAGAGDEGEGEGEAEEGSGYGFKQDVVDLSQFDTADELLDPELVPAEKLKEVRAEGEGSGEVNGAVSASLAFALQGSRSGACAYGQGLCMRRTVRRRGAEEGRGSDHGALGVVGCHQWIVAHY